MKTGAETTSLLLLREFCDCKPESVRTPVQGIQAPLFLNKKSKAAQNSKHSHVTAARNLTLREALLALLQTPPLAFFVLCIYFIYSFYHRNKRGALPLKQPV